MSEQAPPLPKHLYDKIKEAGLAIVGIHWQGGSDEGNVHITSQANDQAEIKKTAEHNMEIVEIRCATRDASIAPAIALLGVQRACGL